MIRVKNIQRIDNIIYADYFYLDENDVGKVEFDIEKMDYRYIDYNEEDKLYDIHYRFGHLRHYLETYVKRDCTSTEGYVMWY